MAVSTFHLAPPETCTTWGCYPVGFETLQMSSGNKSKLHGHRQSTTVLPVKVAEKICVSSRGDTEQQLYKPVKNSEKKITKINKAAVLPVIQSYTSLLTSDEKNENKQLSRGHIPQYAKCFTCERIIKEDHFSEHLLFGPAKCLDCNFCYNDCQSFQLWSVEQSFGTTSCSHSVNVSYCNNPVNYLIENLSKSETNIEKGKLASKINDFINKCTSLKDRLPWKQAIAMCKDYLKYNQRPSSNLTEGEPSKSDSDKFGIAMRNKVNGIHASHNEQYTKDNNLEEESLFDILSQDFNLKQLEEATEFVEVHENYFQKEPYKQKSSRKQSSAKKRKQKVDTYISDDESLEYLPIPSDGFYYVSTKSIEECPNCCEMLCPSQFSVNVYTFLITTICVGCKLSIYITSPEVHILTDDDPGSADSKHILQKKKRGRPRKKL